MVRVESMFATGAPPTSVAFRPPLAFSPWHATHFCANIFAPCAGVPPPSGSPVPSGWMLMSQAAISAGVIGLPRLGPAAAAAPAPRASARNAARESLRVDMLHLPFRVDRPARRPVVVLADERRDRRRPRALAALGDDLRARRLHVAGIVPGAALEHRRPAVPAPQGAEARERLRQHRLL